MTEVITKKRRKSKATIRESMKKYRQEVCTVQNTLTELQTNIANISTQLAQVAEYLALTDMRFKMLETSVETVEDDVLKMRTISPPPAEYMMSPELGVIQPIIEFSPGFDVVWPGNEDCLNMSPLNLKELELDLYCHEVME